MKTAILSAIFLNVLTACATAPPRPQPASPQEIQTKALHWANCLAPVIKENDDGVSDGRTIARVIAGSCPVEFEVYFEAITRSDNGRVKQMLRQRQNEMQEDFALSIVLKMRATNHVKR